MPFRWREVGLYLAIVFGVTWGLAVVVLGFPAWSTAHFGVLNASSPIFYAAVWAPDFAAVVLSLAFAGPRGLAQLFGRLVRPVSWIWVLIAIGLFPALMLLLQALHLASGAPLAPASAWGAYAASIFSVATLTLGASGEELGWRGFLLPRLLGRFSPLMAALVLGIVWAIWHIPAFLVSTLTQSSLAFPVFLLTVICLSVFMTWIYVHTRGSILVAGVLPHVMANAAPASLSDYSWGEAALMVAGVVLLVALTGRSLSRRPG